MPASRGTPAPSLLLLRSQGLAAELGVPREQAAVLAAQEPMLIILPTEFLRQRIQVRV